MRLAALYSGGKDSTFALYLAEQMGHEVAYLVNIVSGEEGSWLFHVPNQSVIPYLAQSMGKQLVTAVTKGSEEDDMNALRHALGDLDVEGVVSGAVWSDYQWERINIICGELGLTVISPLWRKDQDMVLNEIIDSGVSAMIIGVYADGLSESWLGRMLDQDAATELRELREKYGISVIGEGGEYETLTIDSPLQDSCLRIDSFEKEWKNLSGTMNVTEASLVSKHQN